MRAALALCLALAALPAWAAEPPAPVYGIEHELRPGRERVLVFAGSELDPAVEEPAPDRLVLRLPNAVLDPSARTQVTPRGGGAVTAIRAREERRPDGTEVLVEVRRRPGAPFELVARGSGVALEFERSEPAPGEIALEFEAAPVAEVIRAVARATGESFVFEPDLAGKVSLVGFDRVAPDEALALLHAALAVTGLAAVPTPGGALRVVPIANAAAAAPWSAAEPGPGSEAPTATLMRLEAAAADTVAATLAPWVGGSALVVAHPETNALILAGPERKLHGLMGAARALDAAAEESVLVRRLRQRSAAELAPILESALAQPGTARPPARVLAADSSNAVVVRGTPEVLAQAREWLARLDAPPEGRGELHVRRVRYADAEDLAVTLGEVARGVETAAGSEALAGSLAGRDYSVAVDHGTRSLVVRADPETWGAVSALLDELDRSPPSIHVEAVLLEVLSSQALSLGFDAFIPFGDSLDPGVGGLLLNPSGGGLFQPGEGPGPSLGARYTRAPTVIPILGPGGEPISVIVPGESFVLTADEQVLASRVLLRPHLQMLSGEENAVFAGDNLPIPVASATASANPLQTQLDIERKDVGVTLRVRPSLGQAGRVRLEIELEASRLAPTAQPAGSLVLGPTLEQRVIQTTVLVAPDEVVVIGGARAEGIDSTRVGTPWLHEIPALGALFRRTDQMRLERQLLLVVQARVAGDPEAQVAETIRRRLALERVVARAAPLRAGDEPMLAVRAASRERRDDAEAIAAHLAQRGEPARVVAWEWEDRKRWDVVLDGYASIEDAASAALRVRDAGFTPEVEVVPPRGR